MAATVTKKEPVDMKLEVVVIPVSDVDRAKAFYEKLGWRLDIDYAANENHRVVQFTPPGSDASIHIGKGFPRRRRVPSKTCTSSCAISMRHAPIS